MGVHDVLSSEPGGGPVDEAVVAAAREVGAHVLAPAAEETDQAPLVPRANVRALAGAGLFAVSVTTSPATVRAVHEVLAGACGATYFCWAQHLGPSRLIDAGPAAIRERHLDDLLAGRSMAAVAFAYLRRPGPAAVTATPVGRAWEISGLAPWVTSWGLADLLVVAAERPDGTIGHHLLAAKEQPGLGATPPLPLAAMGATGSVALTFERLRVPDDHVVAVETRAEWEAQDRVRTAQPSPAALGLAAACIAELPSEVAGPLADEWAELRAASYQAADDAGPAPDDATLGRLVECRTAGLDLAVRCAQAAVAVGGGRSMLLSSPAQRRYREAGFYLIQAQTDRIRASTLRRLTTTGPRR